MCWPPLRVCVCSQAEGSWSKERCCAVQGNICNSNSSYLCKDRTASSDYLYRLSPGEPERYEPTGRNTNYQFVQAHHWPWWGGDDDLRNGYDLAIGQTSGAPGGSSGWCDQGGTYRGTEGEICGGDNNWGATAVEVWYPICVEDADCGGRGSCGGGGACACESARYGGVASVIT